MSMISKQEKNRANHNLNKGMMEADGMFQGFIMEGFKLPYITIRAIDGKVTQRQACSCQHLAAFSLDLPYLRFVRTVKTVVSTQRFNNHLLSSPTCHYC